MIKKNVLLLFLILVLASFLRFWQLDKNPSGLFGDEVDVGYQAYSLLKTGNDYMGQRFPVYIHSLSEWRAPLFIYATIPTIALFGLNEWGVRGGSALYGIIGVFLIYLLGKKIKDERFGLISAFILAILPWHIHYSRSAFEVTLLLDLLMVAVYFFLGKRYLISAFLFALTPYTYSTAALFTPLLILVCIWKLKKDISIKNIVIFAITGLIVVAPFLYMTQLGPAKGRFELLSVFNDDKVIDQINIERSQTWKPEEKIFHNKLISWGEVIVSNYVRAFSPDFLFVHGDPLPRHNVPGTGELYWIFLPILLYGGYKTLVLEGKFKWVIFGWLFLSPLSASITQDGANHATRLFLMITPLIFLIAYGLENIIKRKVLFALVLIFIFVNLSFYIHRYYTHYSYENWKYWNFGYKQSMLTIAQNQNMSEHVFINNTYQPSLLYYLFWTKYDPQTFQKQFTGDVPKENILPGFNGFKLGDKLYFGETHDINSVLKPGSLYLAAQLKEIPGDWDWSKTPPKDMKVLDIVHTPQGQPLFTIVSK